jgi:hypothetical protein
MDMPSAADYAVTQGRKNPLLLLRSVGKATSARLRASQGSPYGIASLPNSGDFRRSELDREFYVTREYAGGA